MAPDLAELERRLTEGELSVFAELFQAHRPRLWRFVHFRMDQRIRGRVDPDDVVQDAYLAAQSRLPHFVAGDFPSSFLWLRLVTSQTLSNTHRTHLSAQARSVHQEQSMTPAAWLPDTSVSLSYHFAAQLTSPSHALHREELAQQVRRALEYLSPLDREIIALRHFEELTNREAANVLQIQPKAASIRYIRALERLQRLLSSVTGSSSGPWK